MPEISIVLPTYNGERYLKQSIESILGQTYTDWELIVVNDCSTDSTQEIIDFYRKKDTRIRTIFNCTNQKLPESLNIGFREAKGEYFTWTSDDNEYQPDALEKMLTYLKQKLDVPFVCTKCDIVDKYDRILGQTEEYDEKKMLINNYVGACFLYRREVAEQIGCYNKSKFLVEDYDYWLRILFKYHKIGYLDEVCYRYRRHGGSLTGKRRVEIQQQLLRLRKEYLKELLEELEGEKALLCCLYYEFAWNGMADAKTRDIFAKQIPEIGMDVKEESDRKIVIYGAGAYGRNAYERYEDKIAFYADRNATLQGTFLNGKRIISLEKMKEMSAEYQIFIAASAMHVYDFFKALQGLGIKKCHVIEFPLTN